MKKALGWVWVLLFAGCATTDRIMYDDAKRTPTSHVEVFDRVTRPMEPYKKIATLSFLGPPEDEGKALRHFIKDAKKLGANAVMYFGPGPGHIRGSDLGFGTVHIFKADALIYQK